MFPFSFIEKLDRDRLLRAGHRGRIHHLQAIGEDADT